MKAVEPDRAIGPRLEPIERKPHIQAKQKNRQDRLTNLALVFNSLHEGLGAGAGDGAQVGDQLLPRHTDTVILVGNKGFSSGVSTENPDKMSKKR